MKRQVITIQPDGTVSGLQVKPGKGVNLQSLGKAKTVRASEIAWDEDAQFWYVDVLQTPGKGPVTLNKFMDAFIPGTTPPLGDLAPSAQNITDSNAPIYFSEYPDAVEVEIAYLDALRLRGEFPRG